MKKNLYYIIYIKLYNKINWLKIKSLLNIKIFKILINKLKFINFIVKSSHTLLQLKNIFMKNNTYLKTITFKVCIQTKQDDYVN